MGNSQSSTTNKINFEDIQYILNKGDSDYILINTLSEAEQSCLIPKTVAAVNETELLNKLLKNGNKDTKIIVYGRNCNDNNLYTKYNQLTTLGFYNVYVYTGGLFEWLMLQDIYGAKEFPTTKKELDIIKYKPTKALNIQLLKY
jgi:rhodanese-related sulfurtransferase